MPYEIVKQRGKYVVRNKSTKRIRGRHASKAGARRQIAAIHIKTKGKH